MSRTLLVFGGRSTALEIAETAKLHHSDEFSQVFLVVGDSEDEPPGGHLREKELGEFVAKQQVTPGFILSMWNQRIRQHCLNIAKDHALAPATVVHPMAFVSPTASLGHGTYIAAHGVVSTNAVVEDHVIVNFNVTVGHDSRIGTHSMLNPGVRISGNVSIGERVLVGANAFVFQGKSVGSDTLIDALTYIDRDIPERQICSSKQLKVFKRIV